MMLSLLALVLTAGPAFIEDDFPAALRAARKANKVLFVDAWAPWCHTCISLREHVLATPPFEAFQDQVVFAAIDTEKARNARFLEKYPVQVWPTLFFIDPKTGQVLLRWAGSADAVQMKALLAGARREGPAAVADADALMSQGQLAQAVEKYRSAGQPESRAVLSMLTALYFARDYTDCARTAVEQLPVLSGVSDRVAGLTWGLSCALMVGKGPTRTDLLEKLVPEASRALALEGAIADDLSGLYELLVDVRRDAGDEAGAVKLAGQWLTFLEGQAGRATTPAQRAVFDPHRVSAALAAGEPGRAVEALQRSEADFPRDYNPPARLAVLYRALKSPAEGLKAIERALSRCQGPRKLRLYETKAGLLGDLGDLKGQRAALSQALKYGRSLPRAQVTPARLDALQKALDGLG